jgi:hypothetical protein
MRCAGVATRPLEEGNMQKVAVVLDEQQQNELKMILADMDAEAALIYLKEVIWAQVQDSHHKELRGHLEKGAA